MTNATLPKSSRYIPWLFVAGFAVVVAVNGIMMWFAIGSFSGLYAVKPRDRGLHYNQVVAAQQQRDALGWRVDMVWHADTNRFDLKLLDADGAVIADAELAVELVRPAEKRAPLAVAMRNVGDGHFAGYVTLPARGNWDVDIVVVSRGKRFAITRRMFLR